jgi:hypothetical protein
LLAVQVAAERSQALEQLEVVVVLEVTARFLSPTVMALHIPSLLGLVGQALRL